MPASRSASSKEASLSLCTPTPFVKNILLGTIVPVEGRFAISLFGNPRFSNARFARCLPSRGNYRFPDPFRVRFPPLIYSFFFVSRCLWRDASLSHSLETHGFPTLASLTAFLHGKTRVFPTPFLFDSLHR